jgi:hypothetical protein
MSDVESDDDGVMSYDDLVATYKDLLIGYKEVCRVLENKRRSLINYKLRRIVNWISC